MLRPADPYNLLNGNWPEESAAAYREAGGGFTDSSAVAEREADLHEAEAAWTGNTDFHEAAVIGRGVEQEFDRVSRILHSIAELIDKTKTTLAELVESGTVDIENGGDRATVMERITAVKAEYDAELDWLGRRLEAA